MCMTLCIGNLPFARWGEVHLDMVQRWVSRACKGWDATHITSQMGARGGCQSLVRGGAQHILRVSWGARGGCQGPVKGGAQHKLRVGWKARGGCQGPMRGGAQHILILSIATVNRVT
jgi:hypothetical protein